MAEHADTAEQIADPVHDTTGETDGVGTAEAEKGDADSVVDAKKPKRQRLRTRRWVPRRTWFTDTRSAIAVGVVVVAALTGVLGWYGYRAYEGRESQAQRGLYVQVARQTAINLTTINYAQIEGDFQRIMDSSTGALHESVETRYQDFAMLAKQEQSKMEGRIEEAALESADGDHAKVLVAVSVKISTAAESEQKPRRYRWRMSVDNTPDGAKVSNFELVP